MDTLMVVALRQIEFELRNAQYEMTNGDKADRLLLASFVDAARHIARDALAGGEQTNYEGPEPSVECGYPGCTNRLLKRDGYGPQFCSKEHRALAAQEGDRTCD